jgi:hypothetical protein
MEQYHLSAILEGGLEGVRGTHRIQGGHDADTMFKPTMDTIGGHELAGPEYSSDASPITVIGGARASKSMAQREAHTQSITSSSGEFSASTVHKSLIDLFDGLKSRRTKESRSARDQAGQPPLKRKSARADNLDIINILAQEKTNSDSESASESDTDYDSYSE